MLVAGYHMLDRDEPYRDLGGDYFLPPVDPKVQTRGLVTQLQRLDHTVALDPRRLTNPHGRPETATDESELRSDAAARLVPVIHGSVHVGDLPCAVSGV